MTEREKYIDSVLCSFTFDEIRDYLERIYNAYCYIGRGGTGSLEKVAKEYVQNVALNDLLRSSRQACDDAFKAGAEYMLQVLMKGSIQ